MNKARLIALVSVGAASGILTVKAQQSQIEVNGLTRKIIAEHVLSGPLTELNGRYKMVAVDFAIAPGGYVGPHLHAGPGYRCVTHGVVTNVEADGKTTEYHPGECYFEGGDKSHTPRNNGDTMVLVYKWSSCPQAGVGVLSCRFRWASESLELSR
jgi:quercetin dioxygenase-like cupin family protein